MQDRSVYYIEVDGQDVTGSFTDGATSITVTDSSGATADSATIDMDDTDGTILLPQKGAAITIGLGWSEPVVIFEGTVEKVSSTGGRGAGRSLSISAKSADVGNGKAKRPAQRHKDDATLGDVAQEWGKASGIEEVQIHADLASIKRPYWSMNGESFLAWGERTARSIGATFKVMGRRAVMTPRSAGISTDGRPLTKITATFGENLIGWSLDTDRGRPTQSKFKARHFDQDEATWKVEEADPEYETDTESEDFERWTQPDGDEAKRRTKSRSKESSRERGGGTIEIDGQPEAQAEATITLSGARPGVDGDWLIDSVTHKRTRGGGFTTSCSVKLPGSDVGKDTRASESSGSSKGRTPKDSDSSIAPSTGPASSPTPTASNPTPNSRGGIGSDAGLVPDQ